MSGLDNMKEQIKQFTKQQKKNFKEIEEPWETITLYHGTTSKNVNDIIENGLTPRKTNLRNNFVEVPSNEELVYLTTKWHYWYAYNANQKSLIEQVGLERYNSEPISYLWNETSDFPMYISCEVPVELLTIDEDVVYQNEIRKALRNGQITTPKDISLEFSLSQGTVASLLPILPEYINEFIILGSPNFREYLLEGQYGIDASNWFRGLGTGQSDVLELNLLEFGECNNQNGILSMEYPPENTPLIDRIFVDNNGIDINKIKTKKAQ